jgi:oxygen-independent coproporphyrinogen-3 oxidase
VSFENVDMKKGYVYALLKEIDYYYANEGLKTFYIGGGTPSLLQIDELEKIVPKFNFDDDCERTIELNPNDITEEYLRGLKSLGFNRLSIGSQTFDDEILKLIGRRHTSSEIYQAVELSKKVGFDNISVDLIYGLPTQNLQGFQTDLNKVLDLDVQHISLYGLKIDEGCYFYKHIPAGMPDDDVQADMYELASKCLIDRGYEHYEISNYAKSGFGSKHNTNYWTCGEYYGFGVSAHGFRDNIRYSNPVTLKEYMDSPTSREYGHFLTEKERLEERIFLGFRLRRGIDVSQINSEFKIDFDKEYRPILDKYLLSGHIIKTENGYAFSDGCDKNGTNGFLISNVILSEFV